MTALPSAPSHWTRTTIGEIAEVRLGRQRSPKNHSGEHMRPYLRSANVGWGELKLEDVKEMNFTDDEMATYRLKDGDILVVEGSGSATEVGKCVAYRGEPSEVAFQNTLIRVRPGDGVDSRWLMHRINAEAMLGGFLRFARGVGIFHLGSTRTNTWPIAVPPLTEQQTTIDIAERLLSRLDAAMRTLASVEARKTALRQAVILHETNADRHAPMGDIATTSSGGTPKSSEARLYDGDVPWMNSGELADQPVTTTARNISQAGLESSSAKWVEPNTLLIAMYGASIGRLGINKVRLTTNQAVAAVVPDPAVMDVRFLFYRLMGDRRRLVAAGKGGAQNNISQGVLRAWKVPVPSLEDQRSAVQRIERALSFADAAGTEANRALTRTEHLRRSILKAAFEGRLTDPKQIESSLTTIEEAVA